MLQTTSNLVYLLDGFGHCISKTNISSVEPKLNLKFVDERMKLPKGVKKEGSHEK